MSDRFIARLLMVIPCFGMLLILGCDKAKSEVSGHVSLGGQPLADGVVTFRPAYCRKTGGPEFSGTI